MGSIHYGQHAAPIQVDDRTLAHLKIVVATKLRRGESFTLSWQHGGDDPPGRSTIWLHPAIPLRFTFESAERQELSRTWLIDLAKQANSSAGLSVSTASADARCAHDGPTATETWREPMIAELTLV